MMLTYKTFTLTPKCFPNGREYKNHLPTVGFIVTSKTSPIHSHVRFTKTL